MPIRPDLAAVLLLSGCSGECGLEWYGGGQVDLSIEGDAGRVGWFVPGVQKVDLDEGWIAAQAGDAVLLEGAWLVHGTAEDERQILLRVSSTLPAGQACDEDHVVSLELLFAEDQLKDAWFEVTAVSDGRTLVSPDESLKRGEPTVSDAPYVEGELAVPSNRWTVDPACTAPVRGGLTVTWALDAATHSGGSRKCNEAPLSVDQLRTGG